MCWACEERDMLYLYELERAVELGVIPEGFEPADFEAVGLPVPGRRAGEAPKQAARPATAADKFSCDTPDAE